MILFDGTHLVSDQSLDELHKFAQGIGLKRVWFQNHPVHPHYDILSSRIKLLAIRGGAKKVSPKKLVELYRGKEW